MTHDAFLRQLVLDEYERGHIGAETRDEVLAGIGGIDVERLADAMHESQRCGKGSDGHRVWECRYIAVFRRHADSLADAYAALASTPPPSREASQEVSE